MDRVWQQRKLANERIVTDFASRSPVMVGLGSMDLDAEWRTIAAFNTKTLVKGDDEAIRRAGPVVVGIRYHERHLSEAPHPMELVSVLRPQGIFHPNCSTSGALCLGHPAAGISMELILHQIWAGLMFNMKSVNTRPGQIVNLEAAIYVRASAEQFPITTRGLFEQPDDDLLNRDWHSLIDRKVLRVDTSGFADGSQGGNE